MRLAPLLSAFALTVASLAAAAPAPPANGPAHDRAVLTAERARLAADPKADAIFVPDGPSIHADAKSKDLPKIRAALVKLGYLADGPAPADDQTYGGELMEAVERFQEDAGLSVDGIIGPSTRQALRGMDADRLLKLDQTLAQRDPPSKGRYLLVNIAAGMVYGIEDGSKVFVSKAVIGKPDHQTDQFSARVEAITVNPVWTAPESIVMKEFGGNAHVEKPGPKNPLGKLALDMPNRYEIFLHSTNEPGLFGYDHRAFSHGCVRVEKITDLGKWLLGADRWQAEDVDTLMDSLKTHRIALDTPMPVYIQYRTATVGSTGAVIYHADPYGYALPPPPPEPETAPVSETGADLAGRSGAPTPM
jgi:murein L,D-transpeptidase YcbB/YkuD